MARIISCRIGTPWLTRIAGAPSQFETSQFETVFVQRLCNFAREIPSNLRGRHARGAMSAMTSRAILVQSSDVAGLLARASVTFVQTHGEVHEQVTRITDRRSRRLVDGARERGVLFVCRHEGAPANGAVRHRSSASTRPARAPRHRRTRRTSRYPARFPSRRSPSATPTSSASAVYPQSGPSMAALAAQATRRMSTGHGAPDAIPGHARKRSGRMEEEVTP